MIKFTIYMSFDRSLDTVFLIMPATHHPDDHSFRYDNPGRMKGCFHQRLIDERRLSATLPDK